jgi:hypothetical protein
MHVQPFQEVMVFRSKYHLYLVSSYIYDIQCYLNRHCKVSIVFWGPWLLKPQVIYNHLFIGEKQERNFYR